MSHSIWTPHTVSWIGCTETHSFNDSGELFHFDNHDVTVTIPPDAVPKGRQGELKIAATQ